MSLSLRSLSTAALITTATACASRGGGGSVGPHRAAPVPAPVAVSAAGGVGEEDLGYLRLRMLMVPVKGVSPSKVPDTFNERRGSRRHNAVDILAPRGTPVLSADEGRVLRLRRNAAGGITVYAVDPGERFVYYYAHLDRYREGLNEGTPLAKGDVIGYVGTTGNAPRNVPHLHFQVMRMSAERRRYWDGVPVDPRPFLALDGAAPAATGEDTVTEQSALSGKDRASLRAEAHHLTPSVHVGQQGITPSLIQSLDDALRTRELVKVQLGRQVDTKAKNAAGELAAATGSSVVQVIGKTVTLYRANPELPRQKGELPPWRR